MFQRSETITKIGFILMYTIKSCPVPSPLGIEQKMTISCHPFNKKSLRSYFLAHKVVKMRKWPEKTAQTLIKA